ncbi:MAG TPA: hypothetical protein VGS06_35235 [Streptosporangiaceae bacterium]|nr:hypothetical protein [Streptosporangiaceae bacterium]
MSTPETTAAQQAHAMEPVGKAAFIASVGGTRGYADWTNPDHRLRRLLAEFLATGHLSTWWVYLIGPVAGAVIAVGVAQVLRGPARAQEASAAQGTPLNRTA